MIDKLADVYVKVNADLKRTILRVIETPIKKMGSQSEALVELIETCKNGTETLVIRIVYLLTELGKHPLISKFIFFIELIVFV